MIQFWLLYGILFYNPFVKSSFLFENNGLFISIYLQFCIPRFGAGVAVSASNAVPTSAQILNMQMTRAMAMGLGGAAAGNNFNPGKNHCNN